MPRLTRSSSARHLSRAVWLNAAVTGVTEVRLEEVADFVGAREEVLLHFFDVLLDNELGFGFQALEKLVQIGLDSVDVPFHLFCPAEHVN